MRGRDKWAVVAVLLAIVAIAVAACKENGSGESGASTDMAAGEDENVSAIKKLRVAMECGYAPYNWTQPTDENGAVPISGSPDYAYGYDVMIAKHMAKSLNRELEIVKLDWDSLVPAVQSGAVDCVIAGQSITHDRLRMVDFSQPYYHASVVTLVKSDGRYANASGVSDLTGAVCTSQQNTVWYNVCLPQIKDAKILPAQESAPAMLVALAAGKCDLVVTDLPTAKAALAAYRDFKMLDFGSGDDDFVVSDGEMNIGIALRKGNTELKEEIDRALAKMTADDFSRMMDEAVAAQPLSR